MFGGFGGVGSPPSLIEAILESGVKELTVICNDAGFPEIGIGPLIVHKRVKADRFPYRFKSCRRQTND